MKFSVDWFSYNAEGISSCLSKLQNKNKFLEIGCWEGMSTTWFIQNYLDANGSITVIDTFEGGDEHRNQILANLTQEEKDKVFNQVYDDFMSNIKETIGKNQKYEVMKNTSYNALAELIVRGEKFDFIYIDGSHEASDVLIDAVMSFPLLNSGGIMIFDDYTWGDQTNPFMCPKLAIDAFGSVFNNKFEEVLFTNQIGIMKK
jgi:predicted O-methyltransferase YrrM